MKDRCFIGLVFLLFFNTTQIITASNKCEHRILEDGEKLSRNYILYLHNEHRTMVVNGTIKGQPKASAASMNMLKWDPKLEDLAAEVSRSCEFKHVDVNTTEFPNGLGQNLFRSCSNKRRKQNWKKVIGDWYNENRIYRFPDEPTISNGHYTQLIWGKTKFVGCAYTEYFRGNSTKLPYCTLYVCHYAPRGNVVGETPYKPAG
ncbi:venom allergen 5-like [Coccinella septempunctata]|uniref:venom allergen 5-like n=1 Tax=Coccinella septempunctata TaxID=41139 RepID=UPI001D079C41|nr:venom allergen 5-like [Coccinella septempunctata]